MSSATLRPRRAAVLGSPIGHSRSPDLHNAAYAALGLTGWRYGRIDCTAEQLPALAGELADDYVGVSVTMPAKVAALEFADTVTDRARLVGSANTLVRTGSGWHADCTDIDGVSGALATLDIDMSNASAVVVGAGGTARPAVAAIASSGASHLTVAVRDPDRCGALVDLSAHLGLHPTVVPLDDIVSLRAACAEAAVTVSTIPASAAADAIDGLGVSRALIDAIYDPWPTPLSRKVTDAGGQVASGLIMLLHQAFAQVEAFTGMPAPRAAMAAVLSPDLSP